MANTVKQAAEITGISVQAIYQRINKLNDNEKAVYISTDSNGSRLLSDTFVEMLKGNKAAATTEQLQELKTTMQQKDEEIKRLSAELQAVENSRAAEHLKAQEQAEQLQSLQERMRQQEIEIIQAKEQGRTEERERLQKDIDELKDEKARLYAEIDTLHNQISNLIQQNGNNQILLLQAKSDGSSGNPMTDKKKKGGFFGIFGRKAAADVTEGADE